MVLHRLAARVSRATASNRLERALAGASPGLDSAGYGAEPEWLPRGYSPAKNGAETAAWLVPASMARAGSLRAPVAELRAPRSARSGASLGQRLTATRVD